MKVQTEESARLPDVRPRRGAGPVLGKAIIRLLLLVQPFVAALLFFCLAGLACAAPGVFMEPGEISATPNEEFELSFRVDDCGDSVASYQLYMSFDPELVELVEAVEGSLYVDSGVMTWFVHEEEEPGFWHFFDTVFGSGTYVAPPGELLHLRFRVLPDAIGYTRAHVDTIRLTNTIRDPLPVATVGDADIYVPSSSVDGGLGVTSLGPPVPNPFTVWTRIPFSFSGPGSSGRIRVYDAAGRLVRRLSIPSTARRGEIEWDGMNENNVPAAPGVYLIEFRGGHAAARTKAIKLR